MFLNNSYFNVLRKVDKSWEERGHSKRSNHGEKVSFWKRHFSRSQSSQSSRSVQTSSFSSDESGQYSADINSGYYGDDEVEPCPKCLADSPVGGAKADIDDYDVISIQVNKREETKNSKNFTCRTLGYESVDYDDEFVVIPSAREEFCSGNFRHSTPINKRRDSQVHVTCTPKVVTSEHPPSEQCSCVTTVQKPIRFRLYAPRRSSSDTGVWWRENITWQLKQRNKTQTKNFTQFQDHGPDMVKPKVRINRELADYLNKYAEFRPHNDGLNTAFTEREPNFINKSEILQAIRSHSGIDRGTRLRSNSMALRATTYMESLKQTKERELVKDTDEEDNHFIPPTTKRSRSKSSQYRGDRPMIPLWRESITDQLQMRNFLECKYFTDAIVRRTLSQLSISVSQSDCSKSVELLTDYDVITDDDITVVMNEKSVSSSQSVSQGYHSSQAAAFIIKNLDAKYSQKERSISMKSFR